MFLLFEGLVLSEMLGIFLSELLKHGPLVCCLHVHCHELFHGVMSVDHCNTVLHDLLLLELDGVETV